jgi:6-phosphogluconolactonase
MTTLTTRRFATRDALDTALEQRLAQAIAAAGPRAVMLSGGHTPLPAYRAVASHPPPHDEALHIFLSDDRYVPRDSEASNYHQVRPLLDSLALAPESLLRVRTELPLEEAAADYERALGQLLASGVRIVLGLLGLGANGHTASLFTALDLTRARGRLAIAVQRPDGMSGISVTPEVLARIEVLLFVVAGDDKQNALRSLEARDPKLTAWRAVQDCRAIELWTAVPGD